MASRAGTFHAPRDRPGTYRVARPRTAVSTARQRTSLPSSEESSWTVAIFETHGVGREVGIAACNKAMATVVVTQVQPFVLFRG